MTTKQLIFIFILATIFCSCIGTFSDDSSSENFKLTKADDFNLKIISPDTIEQEQTMSIKIHIDNTKYKLRCAFYGCKMTEPPTIGTIQYYINGCQGEPTLPIEKDTIRLGGQTAPLTGEMILQPITILAVDKNNNFYYDKCTVKFFIK